MKNRSQGEGLSKTPHRQRGFEKPLTGKGLLKKPSQGEEFYKTPHRERGFEKPLTGRRVLKAKHVCMFENSERVYLNGGSDSSRKTFSIERMLSMYVCMYVCRVFRNHSPCEGFVKTPLPVKGFSKHLSL